MDLLDLYKSFQNHQVRYLICGGLAINMYGVPRSTEDIDIALNIDTLKKIFPEISYDTRTEKRKRGQGL